MSFSAEMKDFLGAYEKGQKINASRTDQDYKDALTESTKKKTERENDPESLELEAQQARANLAKTQDSLKSAAASRGLTGASTALRNEQLRQLKLQGAGGAGSGLFPTGAINPGASGPQPSPGGAVPIAPSTLDDQTELYADGGMVPDDDEPDDIPSQSVGAVPINPINQDPRLPAQTTSTDMSARRRGLNGVVSPDLIHDATRAGMAYGAKEYGLMSTGAVQTPAQRAKAQLFAQGHGGLTTEEMDAARKAVDPEGKLTDSQRNMAALGSVYQYWANKGEGDKASKVAFQMLQHYRNASQRYAAIAAHAAQGGNVDLATKAAMKAYANVPDGNDLELLPNPDGGIMYAVTGPDGNVTTKGIATPQQLASSAMGLASGGFDKAILTAAGQREEATGAVTTGGKTQTATDRAKEAEIATAPIEKLKTKWQEKNKDKPVDEGFWDELGSTAQHILQQNKNATGSEAASAAMALITPGKADPEKPDFKLTAGEEGQPHTVQFKSGLKIQLDDNQLEQVMNARAQRVKAATDAQDAKMAEEDRPGFLQKAVNAGKSIGGALSDIGGEAGQAVGAVGQIAGRMARDTSPARAAADEAARAQADAIASKFRNPGAIPLDDGDRPL